MTLTDDLMLVERVIEFPARPEMRKVVRAAHELSTTGKPALDVLQKYGLLGHHTRDSVIDSVELLRTL